jgi:hypothetical protein
VTKIFITGISRNLAFGPVAGHIAAGTINRKTNDATASVLYGGTKLQGLWTQRDSFE